MANVYLAWGGLATRNIDLIGVYDTPHGAIDEVVKFAKNEHAISIIAPSDYDPRFYQWDEEFYFFSIQQVTVNEAING